MNSKKNTEWLSKKPKTNHLGTATHSERDLVESTFSLPGRVYLVGELVEHDSGFSKKELVILTEDYKPTHIKFEFTNKETSCLNGLVEGEKIKVTFRIEGREWNGKYLNNLIGTQVAKISEQAIDTGKKIK